MEEEDYDYGTPIGQIIKHINQLCKKPAIDHQLSNAIDVFHEKLCDQEKYLVNGIFRINFAESALFLQSCAELYGRKIDVLWKDLMEFHTRLIKYDYEHQKEKGGPINKQDIERLEERRNRYLRKKNFKLIQEEQEQKQTAANPAESVRVDFGYLIHEDGNLLKTDATQESEEDCRSIQKWNDIENETKEHLKIPYIVFQQMTRTYRLKNYPILKSEDFDLLDLEDEEFNSKYSRVPGWHHMQHLIEYNDQGLLPDEDNVIATLKLAMSGKVKFLIRHKIPLDTPFEQYKGKYIEYCNQFYKEEAKKWQNMPLDTLDDFRKQLQFLATMHGKKCINKRDKIEILDTSDEDSLFESIDDCPKETVNSDLFVRLEKLSGEEINTKLRQDSGFFEMVSNEDENLQCSEPENAEKVIDSDVNGLTNVDNNVNNPDTNNKDDKNEDGSDNNKATEEHMKNNTDKDITNNNTNGEISNYNDCSTNDNNDDNFDARSYVSDHDYCAVPPENVIASVDSEDSCIKDKEILKKVANRIVETFKVPLGTVPVFPQQQNKLKEPRKRQIEKEMGSENSPPKRRKLSQKQIEALLMSKVTPVKLMKFEKFFSENYQPEEEEGVVPVIEYNDDDSAADNLDLNTPTCDNDDVRSIMSDHSYCAQVLHDTHHDSGFIDTSQLSNAEEIQADDQRTEQVAAAEIPPPILENENQNATPARNPAASSLFEKDWLESRARVDDWRNTINPILRNLKEKDFDIHEYGSQIIEGMEVNESRPFSDIVQGKSSAEVVRYFISSLQLANTNNIEICGAKQGQLSNDTYNVKLLSRDRYHEHLNEYLAPSEETLAEKLERVRSMNDNQAKSNSPKAKQPKQGQKVTKGKQFSPNMRKKVFIKVTRVFPNNLQSEAAHNKENCSTIIPDKMTKGKNIVKRQTSVPLVLNHDLSLPSTSSQASIYDHQMPSTSTQASPPRNREYLEVNKPVTLYGNSPNKRRRSESSEESFQERLVAAQSLNPDIQMYSTPCAPRAAKTIKVSSTSKQSVLF